MSAVKANLQLIYVSDISRSTEFYKEIFNTDPIFSSPRYVAFSAGGNCLFALWTGNGNPIKIDAPRFSEIGIMLPSNKSVDHLFEKWEKKENIDILSPPVTEVFGRTFLVKDPDGHVIRVCPLD